MVERIGFGAPVDPFVALRAQTTCPQSNQLLRRARILATARALLASRGYAGVSMRDLAAEADVSPQTIYNMFAGREDVIRIAVTELIAATSRFTREAGSEPAFVLGFIDVFGRFSTESPDFLREMTIAFYPPHGPLYHPVAECVVKVLREPLASLQSAGLLKQHVDFQSLGRHILNATSSAIWSWAHSASDASSLRDDLFETSALLLIGALKPPAADRVEAFLTGYGPGLEACARA